MEVPWLSVVVEANIDQTGIDGFERERRRNGAGNWSRTRKHYSAEEKIPIVLAGWRGEGSIAKLCRREGIAESLGCDWSKEFSDAGKVRLAVDNARQAS